MFSQAAFPMYQLKTKFNPKNILNVVANEIEQLKTQLIWSSNDKKTLENVVSKFSATCNPEKGIMLILYHCVVIKCNLN